MFDVADLSGRCTVIATGQVREEDVSNLFSSIHNAICGQPKRGDCSVTRQNPAGTAFVVEYDPNMGDRGFWEQVVSPCGFTLAPPAAMSASS